MDPNMIQGIAVVGAVAVLSWVLLRKISTRQAAGARGRETGSEPGPEPWRSRGVIDGGQTVSQVQQVVLELESFSREVEARLDTKIHYLRKLIEEADRVADRLAKENARAGAGALEPGPRDPRRDEAERLAEEGLPAPDIAARTGLPEGEVELILGLRQKRGGG
jgi:hypothetical protein